MRFPLKISIFFLIFNSFLYGLDDLSVLAGKYETDKGPVFHNYTPIYHMFFKNIRQNPIKLLEIGFFKGASARMWEQYFPKAELHFVDLRYRAFEQYGNGLSNRCHFHELDQANVVQLKAFVSETAGNFDIIIDDGGHTMIQQITSFKVLFPAVKSGGVYVIEDTHTSYWKRYGGYGTFAEPKAGIGTTIQFIKDRLDDVNYIAAATKQANREKCPDELLNKLSYYQKHIDSVHFYSGIVFIFKR